MSEFEYLSVFVSIIFGISLTHILSGVIRSVYRAETEETHLVLTGFFFVVMILNWWTAFSWRSVEKWSFDLFLLIIVWSISHYLAAITLYPPQAAGVERPFEYRRKWFLWAFVGVASTDILQTAARGDAFSPWYFLPFVFHYIILALVAIFVDRPRVHRWIARYFLVSIVIWSMLVRRFLT